MANNWMPETWTLETVPTQIGSCHKVGPLGEKRNGQENWACIYDDGADIKHPTPKLMAAARLMVNAPALYKALDRLTSAVDGPLAELKHASAASYDGPVSDSADLARLDKAMDDALLVMALARGEEGDLMPADTRAADELKASAQDEARDVQADLKGEAD